jgi:hypothetical protein
MKRYGSAAPCRIDYTGCDWPTCLLLFLISPQIQTRQANSLLLTTSKPLGSKN